MCWTAAVSGSAVLQMIIDHSVIGSICAVVQEGDDLCSGDDVRKGTNMLANRRPVLFRSIFSCVRWANPALQSNIDVGAEGLVLRAAAHDTQLDRKRHLFQKHLSDSAIAIACFATYHDHEHHTS
jgi:hypothetical protein